MKKFLFMMLAVLLALPAMPQVQAWGSWDYTDEYIPLKYEINVPFESTPYAVVIGNTIDYWGFQEYGNITIPSTVSAEGEYWPMADYPVVAIGSRAFEGCKILRSITIPNSVTEIGLSAFNGCVNLTSVTIPNSVTKICGNVFEDCSNLTSVTIPNSVTEIGFYVFRNCRNLTSVTLPNSLTEIPWYTFEGCRSLTSVNIPDGVTSIGSSAFQYCSGLTSLPLPSSLSLIGYSAFEGCSGLTSVTIPNSVTGIRGEAFSRCQNLVEINYNTTEPVTADKDVFSDYTYKKATLNVAVGGLDKAHNTEPWMYFENIKEIDFPSGIEEVITGPGENAPVEVYNLSGVKVADTLDSLPSGLYIVRQGKTAKKVAVK